MTDFFTLPQTLLFDLTHSETLVVCLLFTWTGFVRTGLGFGGAALGLPLMLFVRADLLLWLPVIGTHLLFFSGLTLSRRLHHVDWAYLRYALSVNMHFIEALSLIPIAAIGHFMGLKAHNKIIQNDQGFKQWAGAGLVIVSMLGLFKLYQGACLNSEITTQVCELRSSVSQWLFVFFNTFSKQFL